MLLAWEVKWKNSFRDFTGVVVEQVGEDCVVLEGYEEINFKLKSRQLTRSQPGIVVYASYRRKLAIESLGSDYCPIEVHDEVIEALASLKGDKAFERAKQDSVNNEIALKAAAQRIHISRESDSKFAASLNELKIDHKNSSPGIQIKPKHESSSSDEESSNEGKDEDDEDDSDNDDEDEGEDEDEDEDEEDDESDEEDSDDEEDGSSDDSDDGSSDSSSDDEEPKIGIKVYLLPSNDIRGFSIHLTSKGLESVRKALQKDYGTITNLFYRDSDGDAVKIKSAHDLRYASQSAKSEASASSSASAGSLFKLKLFAEVGSSSTAPGSTAVESAPDLRTSSADTTVRLAPASQVHFNGAQSSKSVSVDGRRSLPLDDCAVISSSAAAAAVAVTATAPRAESRSGTASALNYEVVWKKGELLGSGSFGKVFSGMNLSSGERIAVKEVSLRRGKKHQQQAQALQLEVNILSSLDHPNIIKYLGTEFTKQTLRIFLELANDGTIKDALNEFGNFLPTLVFYLDIISLMIYIMVTFSMQGISPNPSFVGTPLISSKAYGFYTLRNSSTGTLSLRICLSLEGE